MRGYTCPRYQRDDSGRPPQRRVPLYLHPAAVASASCLMGLVLGFALASEPLPPASPTPVASYTPAGSPLQTGRIAGEGVYWVGRDIPAGRYRTTGADAECAWWLAKDTPEEEYAIVAGTAKNRRGEVTLPPGAFFSTHECPTWRRVGPPSG